MKVHPKSILVTGCAGFIGGNFCRLFAERFPKTTMVGIDDLATGRRVNLKPSVEFYEGSVLDRKLIDKIFKQHQPEYIFHFAALPSVAHANDHPTLSTEVNVVGTVNLLEAARDHGLKRFIYSSSSSVYGGAKQLPTSEADNPPNPKSPYAIQKYVNEPFCQVFSQLFGVDTICLRYFNAFGPGQYGDSAYASVIPAWLKAIYFPGDRQPFIEGDGSQSRDFCYVDNVVEANILAMQADGPIGGEAFNIAHGQRTSLNDVHQLIEKLTGHKLPLDKRPPRPGDIKHSYADISRAEKVIGYQPVVSLEEGLQRTVDWFKQRQAAGDK